MNVSEFLPIHAIRAPNIMWFLGAGASAAAGIPTAWNMIWDFKRTLYCSANRVSVRTCQDLGDRRVRGRLQAYFDSLDDTPPADSEEEYAHYFARVHRAAEDRQRYIDRLVSLGTPSFGHVMLAALMRMDKVRVIWTTNFDRMVEDAALTILKSSGQLAVADLDHSRLAMEAMNGGRWPLVVKLHGDFQSRQLKNTAPELQSQDVELRRALVDGCRRYGLSVVGYSGRDQSIMDALEEAIDGGNGYPAGLFWFHRPDSPPLQRVERLIENASQSGIDAHLIEVDTFDALMGDMLLLEAEIPADVEAMLNKRPRRLSDAPIPDSNGTWPVLRFNALRIASHPSTCRRVKCTIGGLKEVRETAENAGADVIVSRVRTGVLAFGSDIEVRKAFASNNIEEFDLHAIEERRLGYDSHELGLLYAALARAIARESPVKVVRKSSTYMLVVDESRENDPSLSALRAATKRLSGTVPRTKLAWAEAARVRLEGRLGRLWLLIEPALWVEKSSEPREMEIAKEFARERRAQRFNMQWSQVFEGWIHVLLAGSETREVRAFGGVDGVDAAFTLTVQTAYSRRAS